LLALAQAMIPPLLFPWRFGRGMMGIDFMGPGQLQNEVTHFIIDNIKKQWALGYITDRCICVGREKNFKFLAALNNDHCFFKQIIPLPYPRFIWQCRRKQRDLYRGQYLNALKGN
jgi:hypothetical protein